MQRDIFVEARLESPSPGLAARAFCLPTSDGQYVTICNGTMTGENNVIKHVELQDPRCHLAILEC